MKRSWMEPELTGLILIGLAVFLILAGSSGCTEHYPNKPIENAPPKTFLWLFPDSALAHTVSRQQLRWWGEDADGFVIGYLFSFAPRITVLPNPDTLGYVYTTRTDTTILFPLTTSTETFLVVVRAVDNTFKGLPVGAIVRLSPSPYWDKNGNGINDAGDVGLPELLRSLDRDGARQRFPIKNSPPSVGFLKDPADPLKTIQQPETTYTVASFSWVGSDPDGDQTLAAYRIALNGTDSAKWLNLPSNITMVTLLVPRSVSDGVTGAVEAEVHSGTFPNMRLQGRLPGLRLDATNVLYLQAQDVAGDYSPIVRLPEGNRIWYVRKPKSRLLVISDYQKSDSVFVRIFYRQAFAQVAGGALAGYDELNIRSGAPIGGKGVLVPPILNPAFVQTLKLYDYVFWYTDQFPSLSVAQFPLFLYTATGGRVLYSTEFASTVADPRGTLVDFAPLDSVSTIPLPNPNPSVPSLGDTRVPKNFVLWPDSSLSSNIYPTLVFDSLSVQSEPIANHTFFLRPIYRRADARYIYRLQPDERVPIRYTGRPYLAVVDDAKRFVFLGLPLHSLNGTLRGGKGVSAFLSKVFVDEFGLR